MNAQLRILCFLRNYLVNKELKFSTILKTQYLFLKKYEKWNSANMHFLKTKFVIKLSIDV